MQARLRFVYSQIESQMYPCFKEHISPMESIPIEQLALTCQTLRDNRILELYREKEALKPTCKIINGVLYVESSMYKASFVLWYTFNDTLIEELQKLLSAMLNGASFTFYNRLGDNMICTDGVHFVVNDDQYAEGDHIHELIIPKECMIPALEAVLN